MICDHWFIMTIYIPLGILGSIPELAAPYFIGKTVDAFSLDDMNEVKKVISLWAIVIVFGALLGYAWLLWKKKKSCLKRKRSRKLSDADGKAKIKKKEEYTSKVDDAFLVIFTIL